MCDNTYIPSFLDIWAISCCGIAGLAPWPKVEITFKSGKTGKRPLPYMTATPCQKYIHHLIGVDEESTKTAFNLKLSLSAYFVR
jgi:hypothetical protein